MTPAHIAFEHLVQALFDGMVTMHRRPTVPRRRGMKENGRECGRPNLIQPTAPDSADIDHLKRPRHGKQFYAIAN